MPSVEMRRSTRVFGARILRSGRRVSTARYNSGKHIRAAHGEDKWSDLVNDFADGGGDAGDRYKGVWQKNKIDSMSVTAEVEVEGEVEMKQTDRPVRIVYKRKRKRGELKNNVVKEDKRFGKMYTRKQWQRKLIPNASVGAEGIQGCDGRFGGFAIAVTKFDYGCVDWIACLLVIILRYMAKVRISTRRLYAFLQLKPLSAVYSSLGVLFIQDSVTARDLVACMIFPSRSPTPLLSFSFSAIPSSFVYMQTSMHFRFARMACLLVAHCSSVYEENEIMTTDALEVTFQMPAWRDCIHVEPRGSSRSDMAYNDLVETDGDNLEKKEPSHSAAGLPKSALRTIQLRNSRKIRKRRSSMRRKKGRPPSAFRALKTSGVLHSDGFRIRQEGTQLATSRPFLRSSYKSSSAGISDLKASVGMLTRDVFGNCCSANLLVSESDRCYREEGVTVTLELSPSNQWLIAVLKDGARRYNLVALKAMRPSWNNRFTHDTIWMADTGWKLEFPNKRDWLVFKELYKECYERNLQSPSVSVIPVPGVHEVSSGVDANSQPYLRPALYITMKDDELTRALEKKSANYDMDSEDEAWLSNLNEELFAGRELEEPVKHDSFELVIDGIEKAAHCNPDDNLDGQAVYAFCMHLERREVIEAIHNYWIKKRKQNHSALVRIFQLYQPRRTQVIPKSILRKKRSFKRQTSQGGRGKQRPLLQAIVARQDISEQQNAHKLEEAKSAAERSEGLAILKRQRAQMLMENADLVTYKALMALRIAEAAAAQIAENPDTTVT